MYKPDGIIVLEITMKKSEKVKGKEAVAARKKLYPKLALVAAAGILIIVIAVFLVLNPSILNPNGAKSGDMVTINYTASLTNGTVFDTTLNATPLTFIVGQGRVIKGLDEGVVGMSQGETRTINIPMAKAYGPYNNALVHVMNRSALPADVTPEVGGYLRITRQPDRATTFVKVINVTPSTFTLDENHELVGQDLVFVVKMVQIQKG